MKKSVKSRSSSVPPQAGPDIAGMINRMQQQLASLEKKIDTLINRPPERPSGGQLSLKPFSALPQNIGQPQRAGEGKPNNGYRERTLHKAICADCNKECEVPFKPSGDRPVYCKECFSKRKKGISVKMIPDNKPREEEIIKLSQPNNKKQAGENIKPKPAAKKKAAVKRRKKRV